MKKDLWFENEFSALDLNDVRLNRRFKNLGAKMLDSPSESIQSVSDTWHEAKAGYRLFDNKKLTVQKILDAHILETVKRINNSDEEVYLVIQDTTKLNYTHHPKKQNMGRLHKTPGFDKPLQGCLLHNTLVINENGLPYGLLNQKIYKHKEKTKHYKQIPITEKESYKWIESFVHTGKLLSNKNHVTVCDRESDIYELFSSAVESSNQVLVRASWDRNLFAKRNDKGHEKLWSYMKKKKAIEKKVVTLPSNHNVKSREAELNIRYYPVTIIAPQRLPSAKTKILKEVDMFAVYVVEDNPPEDKEPVEWMLLTNIKINSIFMAWKMVKWYKARWQIECYHRVLKSGCKIEDCRLEDYLRLAKFITVKSVIAFRILWMTHINRSTPNKECTEILSKSEWQALYCKINKTNKFPKKPPSIGEAIVMIAKLGGFLARKSDGDPGMTYIWRGWEKLSEIAEIFKLLSS